MKPQDSDSPVTLGADQKASLVPDESTAKKMPVMWWASTAILVCIGCALLLAAGINWFGSASSAVAYLRGDRLIPDAFAKSFGTVSKSEQPSVEFLLRNFTKQPIKVLGSDSSCTCLVVSDLPLIIPPNGRAILRVSTRAKTGSRPYSERVRVLTDFREVNLVLTLHGTFL